MAAPIRSRETVDKFLGRFMTSDGRVLSARLNPEIVSQITGISKEDIARETKELDTDPEIAATLLDVAETLQEGGRRRKRGGVRTAQAIKNLITSIVESGPLTFQLLDEAIATTIENIGTIAKVSGTVGTTVLVLNHPTVFGNLAEIGAVITKAAVDTNITSKWSDWWEAFKQTSQAAAILGETVVSQSIQGPVVPAAIAAAIMSYRASKSGKSVWQVIKDDANTVLSVASRGATGFIQDFQDAYQKEAQAATLRSLKELSSTLKKPVGPGAEELTRLVKQTGAPSAQSGVSDEAIAIVPSSKAKPPKTALKPMTDIPKQTIPPENEAAKALLTLAKSGGRKKTRRSPKRRATRRRRSMFVY